MDGASLREGGGGVRGGNRCSTEGEGTGGEGGVSVFVSAERGGLTTFGHSLIRLMTLSDS